MVETAVVSFMDLRKKYHTLKIYFGLTSFITVFKCFKYLRLHRDLNLLWRMLEIGTVTDSLSTPHRKQKASVFGRMAAEAQGKAVQSLSRKTQRILLSGSITLNFRSNVMIGLVKQESAALGLLGSVEFDRFVLTL